MKIDSIIFDLDGTLWDSTQGVTDAFNEIIRNTKVTNPITLEDIKSIMGLSVLEIPLRLFPHLEDEPRTTLITACWANECKYLEEHGGSLFDKLEDTIKKLATKYKLFIVSNCQIGYIEAFLKAHNLSEYFIDYENAERTGLTKGENIKLVVERNNLKNPVYVGDTQWDMEATRFAGIPFVFASYGFGQVDDYDYKIDTFDQLIDLDNN